KEPDDAEKDHVVEARHPRGSLGTIRFPRSQALPNHRRRCVSHAPRWKQRKHDDSDSDGISRDRGAAVSGQDADEPDPTGRSNNDLEHGRRRKAPHTRHYGEIHTKTIARDVNSSILPCELRKLINDSASPSERRRDGGACNAKSRERSNAEDQ